MERKVQTKLILCEEFWNLYDIWNELEDAKDNGRAIDPKALKRAREAVERHKETCKECK